MKKEALKSKPSLEEAAPQKPLRPTKKQFETLTFITEFIAKNGYSPSFREIMTGCNYTSVATVSLHVNSLIKRGHLRKRDHSARSLEVVGEKLDTDIPVNRINEAEEKWLVLRVEQFFKNAESSSPSQQQVDELYVLIGALKILGLEGAAYSYIRRLGELKQKTKKNSFSV